MLRISNGFWAKPNTLKQMISRSKPCTQLRQQGIYAVRSLGNIASAAAFHILGVCDVVG